MNIKRQLIVVLISIFNLNSNVQSQSIEIVCFKSNLIYNDHVGNEWGEWFERDGKYFKAQSPSVHPMQSAHKLTYIIQEGEEKYIDESTFELDISTDNLNLNQWYTKSFDIIVVENGGQFAGNKAKWNIHIKYRRIANPDKA